VSTFPLLLNINNQPTYFMALKDSAGLVKKFAMIDIQRYQNVATGDTVSECQKVYKALLATNGIKGKSGDAATGETVTGTIETMAQAVIDGNSHFYITLKGDDRIYDLTLPGLVEIVAYQVGDEITMSYTEDSPTSPVDGIAANKKEAESSAEANAAAAAEAAAAEAAAAEDSGEEEGGM
jgi:hypothetical protein